MKNSFKHFMKHLKWKLYINPKTKNYNINMQTSKYLINISHLHVNTASFLTKKIWGWMIRECLDIWDVKWRNEALTEL